MVDKKTYDFSSFDKTTEQVDAFDFASFDKEVKKKDSEEVSTESLDTLSVLDSGTPSTLEQPKEIPFDEILSKVPSSFLFPHTDPETLKKSRHPLDSQGSEADNESIQTPSESGEDEAISEQVKPDFDPSYFWGTVRAINKGTSNFFRTLDNASKTIEDWTGIERGGGFGRVADRINETAEASPDVPDTRAGRLLRNVGQLEGLFLELAITPNFKLGKIAKIPKLLTQMTGAGFVNSYADAITEDATLTEKAVEGLKGAGVGAKDAAILIALGYGSSIAGGAVGKATGSGIAAGVSATLANAVGFGGATAIEQLITEGEIDRQSVEESFDIGLALGVPEIARSIGTRAMGNYFTSSSKAEKEALKVNKSTQEMREEAIRIRTEAEGLDTDARIAAEAEANVIDALADIRTISEEVRSDPKKFREAIEKDETLSDTEKKAFIDKIDETAKKAKPEDITPVLKEKTEAEVAKEQKAIQEDQFKLDFLIEREIEVPDGTTSAGLDNLFRKERITKIKEEGVDLDKEITKAQKELDLPETPDIKISDKTEVTLEMIDNKEPVTNKFAKEASEELFKEHTRLENMKESDSRVYSIEQIESMQKFLGEEITKLEEHVTEQAKEGKFIPEIEDRKAAEREAAKVDERITEIDQRKIEIDKEIVKTEGEPKKVLAEEFTALSQERAELIAEQKEVKLKTEQDAKRNRLRDTDKAEEVRKDDSSKQGGKVETDKEKTGKEKAAEVAEKATEPPLEDITPVKDTITPEVKEKTAGALKQESVQQPEAFIVTERKEKVNKVEIDKIRSKVIKEEAKSKLDQGLSQLAEIAGAKLSITGEERAKLTDAIKNISEGLADYAQAKGIDLKVAVKEFISKSGYDIKEEELDKFFDEKKEEKPKAIAKESKVTEKKETVKGEKGTIELDPTKKSVSQRAVSEEAKLQPTDKERQIIEEKAVKSEYNQKERYEAGVSYVKSKTNKNGEVDFAAVGKDIAEGKVNPDIANVIQSDISRIYREKSKNKSLSKEERDRAAVISANMVEAVANRNLIQGRSSAMMKEIYDNNPAFDASVRVVEAIKADKKRVLDTAHEKGGTKREFIDKLKGEADKIVNDAVKEALKTNENRIAELETEITNLNKFKFDKKTAKRIADKVRSAKVPKDLVFGTVVPVQVIWNPMMEVIAKTIEATGSVSEAIQKGISSIKGTDWYKDLSKDQEKRFEAMLSDHLAGEISKTSKIPKENIKISEAARKTIKKGLTKVIEEYYAEGADIDMTLREHLEKEGGLSSKEAKKIEKVLTESIIDKITEGKIDKLTKMLAQNEITGKEAKNIHNRIIEAIKEGALRSDEFSNMFSEKFGFDPITEKDAETIEALVDRIDNLKGEKKWFLSHNEELNLNNMLMKLKPRTRLDVMKAVNDIHYAFVLSGINTAFNAGYGSAFTLLSNTPAVILRKGIVESMFGIEAAAKTTKTHVNEFLQVLNSHRSVFDEFGFINENYDPKVEGIIERELSKPFFEYSKDLFKDKEGLPTYYKDLMTHTVSKTLAVNSLIKAEDAFMRSSAGDMMHAAEEFRVVSKEMGYTKNPFSKGFVLWNYDKVRNATIKKLGLDKESQQQIKEKVAEEIKFEKERGIKLPPGYELRRRREMRIEIAGKELYYKNMDSVSEYIMMSQPDGIPGFLYEQLRDRILSYSESKSDIKNSFTMGMNMILMFNRLAANVSLNITRNTPIVGMFSAVSGIERDKVTGNLEFQLVKKNTDQIMQRVITNTIMTSVGAMAFDQIMNYDKDEGKYVLNPDRLIDFTSWGYGDFKKNTQVGKNKNFAVRFRLSPDDQFGEWYSLRLVPHVLPIVGFLGRWSDDLKGWQGDRREELTEIPFGRRLSGLGDIEARAISEMSFNSLARASKTVKYAKDKGLGGIAAAGTVAANMVQGITQPAVLRDVLDEGMRILDKPMTQHGRGFVATTLRGYKVSELFIKDIKTDLWGRPMPRANKLAEWFGEYEDKYGETDINKVLNQYQDIKVPDVTYRYKTITMTEAEAQDALLIKKEAMNKLTEKGIDLLMGATKADIEFALDLYDESSRNIGRYYTLYLRQNPDATEKEISEEIDFLINIGSRGINKLLSGIKRELDEDIVSKKEALQEKKLKTAEFE
jgi:hypothetical protein